MNDETNPNPTPLPDESASQDSNSAQIAELAAKLAEAENNWKRAAAELVNFKRQTETQAAESQAFGTEKAVLALLPVLDNFRRLAAQTPAELAENTWAKGVLAVAAQAESALAQLGVEKVAAEIGSELNAAEHAPIGTAPGEAGRIVAVLEDGYRLRGKVIRYALVQVGDGSAAAN